MNKKLTNNKKAVSTVTPEIQSKNLLLPLYVISLIVVIIYIIILTYIFQMNSQLCQCASNWKKEFIRYYCFYAILKTVLIVFFYTSVYQKKVFNVYKYADILLFITFVIITVTYINELRKEKCLCSDNWKRKLTLVYAWIGVGMSGLLLVSATIFIFIILSTSYFVYNQKR